MYVFKNFKNFIKAELDLSAPFTLLIGANGSGKSNIIEAIELFGFLTKGGNLHEITDLGRRGQLEIRGGLQASPRQSSNAFSLFYIDKTDGKKYLITVEVHPQLKMVVSQPIQHKNTIEKLTQLFIYDPEPKLMRNYEKVGDDILSKNGANLSAVLYALSKGTEENKQSLKRLLNWIKQLPNESFYEFEFITTQLNDVIFCFKNKKDQLTSANILSDGTLRCLAVLTALETTKPESLVIIEEFDNGLHPSRLKMLVEAIDDCCKRRRIKVLVTTHNPATLNSLNNQQLDGVILCHWDQKSQSSKLTRLSDLPCKEEMLERGKLGDLVTKQVIDQYLLPNFEEQRKEKVLEWLADF